MILSFIDWLDLPGSGILYLGIIREVFYRFSAFLKYLPKKVYQLSE